jgi:hypothetical protein
MNARLVVIFLQMISALGISYFAINIAWSILAIVAYLTLYVGFVAVMVVAVPMLAVWGGVWWVIKGQSLLSFFGRFVASSVFAWAWLYVGSIYLALLRF